MRSYFRYIPPALFILFFNLLIYIFWWVVTDPGNYIWLPLAPQKKALLTEACYRLFLIKYYLWTVILNAFLASILLIRKKTILALCIAAFGLLFYFAGNHFFDAYTGKNYALIFENQHVTREFQLEPIYAGGWSVGPFLLEHLNDYPVNKKTYAIKGLGEIKYTPAIKTLSALLNDTTSAEQVRAECFLSLKKMKNAESKQSLEDFTRYHMETHSDSLLIQRILISEEGDIF